MTEGELSRVAATHRGVHARLAQLDPDRAPSYRASRTLRLRVEFARQLRRRRTQIAFGLLLVLPVIIGIAFKVGGTPSDSSGQLVNVATTGAYNFALFTEVASVGFLLVVVVALFCGDTVASEASWSSLRYLLAQPVPRSRLLRQKYAVAGILSIAANLLLPLWALVVGGVIYGWAPARSPIGQTFTSVQSLGRLSLSVVYICGQLLVVAALAFLLSISVDNPLGAVGGAVMLVVVSNIIDSITALGWYRDFLPTHYQYAWTDTVNAPIQYDNMVRGTGVALVYASVFLGVAFLRFDRKDITS